MTSSPACCPPACVMWSNTSMARVHCLPLARALMVALYVIASRTRPRACRQGQRQGAADQKVASSTATKHAPLQRQHDQVVRHTQVQCRPAQRSSLCKRLHQGDCPPAASHPHLHAIEHVQGALPLAAPVARADGCVGERGVRHHPRQLQGLVQLQRLVAGALPGQLAQELGQACGEGGGGRSMRL